ncbi:FecR domain-containing protein [Chryseobacterium indologenes]|nr:FecR domain-containing protein [Chryseobacterium indologenes]
MQVTVPRGGQYSLYLPDGAKVILNSESSISFPVSFSCSTREINMKGEAYFEVAHNSRRPFIVKTVEQSIKVWGLNLISIPIVLKMSSQHYRDILTSLTLNLI